MEKLRDSWAMDNRLCVLCRAASGPGTPLKLCAGRQPLLARGLGLLLGSAMRLLGHGQGTWLAWCLIAGIDGTSKQKVGRLATVWCQRASVERETYKSAMFVL